MGDTGSTFLGYVMAVASIQGLFKFYAIISFLIPFFMLGVPIFDTFFAVVRRLYHKDSPFKADREHVHYRLLDLGFSKKQTVAMLYGVSALLGVTAVVTASAGLSRGLILLVVLGVAVGYMLRRSHHQQPHHPPDPGSSQDSQSLESTLDPGDSQSTESSQDTENAPSQADEEEQGQED